MESTLEKHWQTIYQTKETTKLRLGDWKEQVKLVALIFLITSPGKSMRKRAKLLRLSLSKNLKPIN